MYAVLIAALGALARALQSIFFSKVGLQFILYTFIGTYIIDALSWMLNTFVVPFLGGSESGDAGLANYMGSNFTAGAWYFFDMFDLNFGLASFLSAYACRFLIRRLPVIG